MFLFYITKALFCPAMGEIMATKELVKQCMELLLNAGFKFTRAEIQTIHEKMFLLVGHDNGLSICAATGFSDQELVKGTKKYVKAANKAQINRAAEWTVCDA